jgi:predicted nuclease with TOPRIM domain
MFHRYGLDFQINRNNASSIICNEQSSNLKGFQINNEQSSNLKGFLAKQNDSLKKENDQLKEQINNYKCIASDLNQKVKDLDNERSSLITVIKILQSEQEQHKTEALSSWNVVNRH